MSELTGRRWPVEEAFTTLDEAPRLRWSADVEPEATAPAGRLDRALEILEHLSGEPWAGGPVAERLRSLQSPLPEPAWGAWIGGRHHLEGAPEIEITEVAGTLGKAVPEAIPKVPGTGARAPGERPPEVAGTSGSTPRTPPSAAPAPKVAGTVGGAVPEVIPKVPGTVKYGKVVPGKSGLPEVAGTSGRASGRAPVGGPGDAFKLYAETPGRGEVVEAFVADLLGPGALLPGCPAPELRMVGWGGPEGGRGTGIGGKLETNPSPETIELYFRTDHLSAERLPALLRRLGLEAALEGLAELLATARRGHEHRWPPGTGGTNGLGFELPCRRLGFSVACLATPDRPSPARPVAFTLNAFARRLFGDGPERIRRGLAELPGGEDVISRLDGAHRFGMVGFSWVGGRVGWSVGCTGEGGSKKVVSTP